MRPFPGPGGKTQISTGGGSLPQWSRNGKELYYIASTRDKIMAVTYTAIADSFRAEKPRFGRPAKFPSAALIFQLQTENESAC